MALLPWLKDSAPIYNNWYGQGIKYEIKIGYITISWKENIRINKHMKRYGDGKEMGMGMGWGIYYRSMEGEYKDKQLCEAIWGWEGDGDGDGVGWGIYFRSMEGEYKDKYIWEEIWGWEGDGVGWDIWYYSMKGGHKDK